MNILCTRYECIHNNGENAITPTEYPCNTGRCEYTPKCEHEWVPLLLQFNVRCVKCGKVE